MEFCRRWGIPLIIAIVVLDQLKPIIRKMSMLDDEGLKHLDVYLNFVISQGFIKK